VKAERRFLVTADKGVCRHTIYQPGSHAGILLLRPDQDGIRPVMELFGTGLVKLSLEALTETVTVVTPRGYSVRRAKK